MRLRYVSPGWHNVGRAGIRAIPASPGSSLKLRARHRRVGSYPLTGRSVRAHCLRRLLRSTLTSSSGAHQVSLGVLDGSGARCADGTEDDDDGWNHNGGRKPRCVGTGIHGARQAGDDPGEDGRQAQAEVGGDENVETVAAWFRGSASRLISLRPPRKMSPTAMPPYRK